MFFHSKKSDSTKNSPSSMKLDVRLKKKRSCINFVANEHHSFTFVFTFSVVVVDLPTDCILSFLFPAETDVLVPLFSRSTDVVVVNLVEVLKVARYSFSRSKPPKFERKLRRHKQGFVKIDTTVVLDKEENWL